jgi:hypothetical protein
MYQLPIVKRGILCVVFGPAISDPSLAEPILIVEIHNTGFAPLTSGQPDMYFSFRLGEPGTQWLMSLTEADEGMTFSAPSDLLTVYDQHLTSSDDVFVVMGCCEDVEHGFDSPPRLNFGNTGGDFITVTRIAPNLGPNLFGYRLTEMTQTIDDITITHVSDVRYNRSGAHTIRIYGEVIPEPATTTLIVISFLFCICLRVGFTRR